MRLLVSWLRDFVDVDAAPQEIADRMALRGFEVASIEDAAAALPPWRARDGRADAVIDFEITANRPDCLNVLGLAREVAAIYGLPLTMPSADPKASIALTRLQSGEAHGLRVTLEDADLCPRYAAAVADVAVGSSPAWLAGRLHAAGVRAISNIVDLTNYVLIELGQPMHAFDLARLADGHIRIRRAQRGETIRTLDGVDRKLEPEMLVIADEHVAQAIAGVMGGGRSEVSEGTRRIALESACFKPASVRITSKRLGLKTEASSRFERGTDVNGVITAVERFAALLSLVGAGTMDAHVVDRYPQPRTPRTIHLRRDRVARLLGVTVPGADISRILTSLGMQPAESSDGFDVTVPTFRVDVAREADLIEEVGRHYGFDRLEPTFPPLTAPAPRPDPRIARDRRVRSVVTAAGLNEAVTFAFIESSRAERFAGALGGPDVVRIANPLTANFEVMRPSLLPGLIDAVAHNRRHAQRDVRLFEIGAVFSEMRGETRSVALAWTGAAADEHWSRSGREVDFFDLSGVVRQVCEAIGVRADFEPRPSDFLVAGQSAVCTAASATASASADRTADRSAERLPIGIIGLLQPAIVDSYGAPKQDKVFVAELDLDAAWYVADRRLHAVAALPRFPAVVRDLSIVVADTLPAAIIRGTIQSAGASTEAPLAGIAFFDRYQGKGIADGAVSVSVRLTFQSPDRTLTDAEVQQSFDQILRALVQRHGAVQR